MSNPILTKQREINQQKYRKREKGFISLKYQILHSKELSDEEGWNNTKSKDLFHVHRSKNIIQTPSDFKRIQCGHFERHN
jgi:hypothetical protein